MSGELEDTQLVSSLLPSGRGNRRVGTEFEVAEVFDGICLLASALVNVDRRRTVAGLSVLGGDDSGCSIPR
jgi:hypothetical protein